jgi:hypothetical protein
MNRTWFIYHGPEIKRGAMSKSTHYTPPLSRFNVCALYHQAKQLGIPMTQLANKLVEAGLKDSAGWEEAQDQMRLGEEVKEFHSE